MAPIADDATTDVAANPLEATVPPPVAAGLQKSVDYLVSQMLEDKHISKLHECLANTWDHNQSFHAAMKLMEQHGVTLSAADQEKLMGLGEAEMIEKLVGKMPSQSKEQFQHFFLQLQLVVSTAARVRTSLEDGNSADVETALNDAESTGISQFILKMAIVQAGSEVLSLRHQQKQWMKEQQAKMNQMVRGQENALVAKKRLAAAQGQLRSYQTDSSQKARKVLMNSMANNSTMLAKSVVQGWASAIKQEKAEMAVYEDYREELERAEAELIKCRVDRLQSVRKVLSKKAAGKDSAQIAECYGYMQMEVEHAKEQARYLEEKKALDAKMAAFSSEQRANAQKVMAKLGTGRDAGLVAMTWQAWKGDIDAMKQEKEMEKSVREQEERTKEFLKGKSENAKGLLSGMASDTGLIQTVFAAWAGWFKEIQEANKLQELLDKRASGMNDFNGRNKMGAMSTMEKAAYLSDLTDLQRSFNAWHLDARLTALHKLGDTKADSKKQQLKHVQDMFRTFATRLEVGIKSGISEDRDWAGQGSHRQAKKLSKTDGSVSLPNIHAGGGAYPADGN